MIMLIPLRIAAATVPGVLLDHPQKGRDNPGNGIKGNQDLLASKTIGDVSAERCDQHLGNHCQ